MTLVVNEKPKVFWADLISQDTVVAHPENLTWVFRRSQDTKNNAFPKALAIQARANARSRPVGKSQLLKAIPNNPKPKSSGNKNNQPIQGFKGIFSRRAARAIPFDHK